MARQLGLPLFVVVYANEHSSWVSAIALLAPLTACQPTIESNAHSSSETAETEL